MPALAQEITGFSSIFGEERGVGMNTAALLRDIEEDGPQAVLRQIAASPETFSTNVKAATVAANALIEQTIDRRSKQLEQWMRWSLVVRPHWMLHVGGSDSINGRFFMHYLPNGHLAANTTDLHAKLANGTIKTACGRKSKQLNLMNRGYWATAKPLASEPCPTCAKLMEGHHETQARDFDDLLPAPILDPALHRIRAARSEAILSAVAQGKSNKLESGVIDDLNSLVIDYCVASLNEAAHPILYRCYGPNEELAVEELDPGISLDEQPWRQLVEHHLLVRAERAWTLAQERYSSSAACSPQTLREIGIDLAREAMRQYRENH
jgi:hypothetical protein